MRYSERWRNRNDSDRDLNLAPFINIVAILIPMLLLSVVFLKVGVIDVSSPSIVPEDQSDDTAPEDRLRLTVAISKSGFEIASADETFAPIGPLQQTDPGDRRVAKSNLPLQFAVASPQRSEGDRGEQPRYSTSLEALRSSRRSDVTDAPAWRKRERTNLDG